MITVIGGGAWGTALATVLAHTQPKTTLWVREPELATTINDIHENTLYLPGVTLADSIYATSSLEDAVSDTMLIVTPAQFMRASLTELLPFLPQHVSLILCNKGIENNSLKLMHEVAKEVIPHATIAVLSGPNFAREVAMGQPSAATIAADSIEVAHDIALKIGSPYYRPYTSTDVIGTEVSGSVKNVLAIACGIIDAKGFGQNSRAALITRGIAEIKKLTQALGGHADTLLGLCGVGDIMLTCNSTASRNFSLGVALGQGQTLPAIEASTNSVSEGAASSIAVAALAKKHQIDMPIATAVEAILHQNANIETIIQDLLHRPFAEKE